MGPMYMLFLASHVPAEEDQWVQPYDLRGKDLLWGLPRVSLVVPFFG